MAAENLREETYTVEKKETTIEQVTDIGQKKEAKTAYIVVYDFVCKYELYFKKWPGYVL